jgi:hypothetical protein
MTLRCYAGWLTGHLRSVEPSAPPDEVKMLTMDGEWPWDTLHAEQEAREGSFSQVVRKERRWDEDAFSRLESAMRAACEQLHEEVAVERWLVEGFWVWTSVVPEISQHEEFSPPEPRYHRRCLARLRDLGSWFFNRASPYGPDHEWEPL